MSEENTSGGSSPEPAAATEEVNTEQVVSEEATPKRKAPQYRKFKIGEEEVALSDDDIKRDYQKWKGADAKFREAAEAKKSVEQFMKALQEDPESVLSDPRLPIDRKKLAEKWLIKQIEEELAPPDPRDLKLSEYERKLKEYEEKENKEKQTAEQKELEAVRESRKSELAKTLNEAMKATHLSAHPESAAAVLREMAMYMRAAKERGEDVTPQELVEHIHNSRFNQLYTLAHQFEGEELIDFLGEEIVNRIRKADLNRIRSSRNSGDSFKTDTSDSYSSSSKKPTQRLDGLAARALVRKKMLG